MLLSTRRLTNCKVSLLPNAWSHLELIESDSDSEKSSESVIDISSSSQQSNVSISCLFLRISNIGLPQMIIVQTMILNRMFLILLW